MCAQSLQSCLPLCNPMDSSPPAPLWDFPDENSEEGCHPLFQGDLPDPGIKPASPALQVDSLPLNHWGSP